MMSYCPCVWPRPEAFPALNASPGSPETAGKLSHGNISTGCMDVGSSALGGLPPAWTWPGPGVGSRLAGRSSRCQRGCLSGGPAPFPTIRFQVRHGQWSLGTHLLFLFSFLPQRSPMFSHEGSWGRGRTRVEMGWKVRGRGVALKGSASDAPTTVREWIRSVEFRMLLLSISGCGSWGREWGNLVLPLLPRPPSLQIPKFWWF